jgi:hypothetical protein
LAKTLRARLGQFSSVVGHPKHNLIAFQIAGETNVFGTAVLNSVVDSVGHNGDDGFNESRRNNGEQPQQSGHHPKSQSTRPGNGIP